ncbi:MAG: dTDP-glucose 4,6-dehydratase [Nitrospinales bacterium]
MKLLITGGAGFIGGNFIRYYLQAHPGCAIVNLDKLTYAGNRASLKDIEDQPAYRFVQGDICDVNLVRELIADGVDVVVNFAAESHVDRSIHDAAVFLDTNIQGTYNLLKCSRDAGVALFLQVSTDEVYGSLGSTGFFTERSTIQPNSPYAASKAAADLVCRSLYETFGFPVIISRSCNNFGPYQFPEKLIPLFITNLLEDCPVPVYGDGLNVRDWIHVEDHCRALDAILQKGQPGEVYNVGARQEKTNLEITTIILRELGKPESYKKFVEDRLGHDRRYAIDPAKLEKELDWRPAFGFEQAIKDTVAWYRDNPEWWKPLKHKTGQTD